MLALDHSVHVWKKRTHELVRTLYQVEPIIGIIEPFQTKYMPRTEADATVLTVISATAHNDINEVELSLEISRCLRHRDGA